MTQEWKVTLDNLELSLGRLTKAVPAAEFIEIADGVSCWRYREKLPEQAIAVKLARLLSAMYAAKLLLDGGLILDVGAAKRILDEMSEDIVFIVGMLRPEGATAHHERFLNEFWQEEFDDLETDELKNLKRDRVPRKKIRAFNSELQNGNSRAQIKQNVHDVLGKTYGGYIHGAAAHTMEIYGGENPRFHVSGLRRTPPWSSQHEDLKQYFYRSVCIFGIVAGAFGDQPLLNKLLELRSQLERSWEMTFDNLAVEPQVSDNL